MRAGLFKHGKGSVGTPAPAPRLSPAAPEVRCLQQRVDGMHAAQRSRLRLMVHQVRPVAVVHACGWWQRQGRGGRQAWRQAATGGGGSGGGKRAVCWESLPLQSGTEAHLLL